jgi:uncharacterized protein (DUF1800 family)
MWKWKADFLQIGFVVGFFALLQAATLVQAAQSVPRKLGREDIQWLNRVTYGIDTQTINTYQYLGLKAYLETQLKPTDDGLPPSAQAAIDSLSISARSALQMLADAEVENKRINAMPDGEEKGRARQAFNIAQDKVAFEAAKRHLLRAVYSKSQLKEQMTWFWLNHFSVFRYKGNLRLTVADYEENAIRANALGNFRDLVRATLRHPAMLVYLDNAQSAAYKINENYARELLELHTMGVYGGYTQHDVQELARVLTGMGVRQTFVTTPSLIGTSQSMVIDDGVFEFNPARHDFGDKVLLGATIRGRGLGEVDDALEQIVKSPATANFISKKLATYFVADEPPPKLVEKMAKEFAQSNGDIPSVLRVLLNAKEFNASLGHKFKDPMHYVVSALRIAYDAQTQQGKTFVNLKPVNNMLNSLGEGLYGHLTPDGYGVRESDWASSGQMSKRFEIAKWIGSGNAGLFDPDDGKPAQVTGFPQLSTRLYFDAIEPDLSKTTHDALDSASAQWEWNAYLLGAPEFMFH